jgi:hypothetical protein
MAYSEDLAERVRLLLPRVRVTEKKMMGGLTFMVNGKMCVGIVKDDLMVRLDPAVYEVALRRKCCRPMEFTGKPMKGFVFVGPGGTSTGKALAYWIALALAFNGKAKASRKRA